MNIIEVCEFINKQREDAGMTLRKVAEKIELDEPSTGRLLNGKNEPRWERVEKLASLIGCRAVITLMPDDALPDVLAEFRAAKVVENKASEDRHKAAKQWRERQKELVGQEFKVSERKQTAHASARDSDPDEIPKLLWDFNNAVRDYGLSKTPENGSVLLSCTNALEAAGWKIVDKEWVAPSRIGTSGE